RIVGAVGRDRTRHGEGGAVRALGRAVVVHRVADGVPGGIDVRAVQGAGLVLGVLDGRDGRVGVAAAGRDVERLTVDGDAADDAVVGALALVDVLGRDGAGGEGDGGDAGEKSDDFHD